MLRYLAFILLVHPFQGLLVFLNGVMQLLDERLLLLDSVACLDDLVDDLLGG